MRIHHLNCGTMRPSLIGDGLVCHVLLAETSDGLVLVDTGFGTHEVRAPKETLHPVMRRLLKPALDIEETAVRQVERLGFTAADVRHVVLTHLDFDHAGGLRDFPHATVHLLEDELEAARNPRTMNERSRYPAQQREGVENWAAYRAEGEPWFGFEAVRDIPGLPDFLLIPLAGHTRGHTGVAVRSDEKWLLHAGDAYFHHGELRTPPASPWLFKAFQLSVDTVRAQRMSNQDRLRELVAEHADEVDVFCSHDPLELTSRASPGGSRPCRA
jgi:glyoxylase-like metal-dependent hydrolase (beta-lactamase superfamily II)